MFGGISRYDFLATWLLSSSATEFWKSVNIWGSCWQEFERCAGLVLNYCYIQRCQCSKRARVRLVNSWTFVSKLLVNYVVVGRWQVCLVTAAPRTCVHYAEAESYSGPLCYSCLCAWFCGNWIFGAIGFLLACENQWYFRYKNHFSFSFS